MKIKEIKLYGFKSFQEETKFLLNPGITSFVGPNGSGKSNIFDALRWVFGEQSMKALRCERNEDLIHISADGQSDSNFAEVAVTINNEDFFPQFGSEFEIRRRFYRDGESEFYLNRVKCRLQDIQALFLNSGTLTYSFLELSEIEKIISGDTKEMFDDVAGILRYQERREQTKRRLDQTEQDLLRLEDVIGEMERTVRALKRQARQTQLYQELRDEFKKISLVLLKTEYEKTLSELNQANQQIEELNQHKQSIIARLNSLEQKRQERRTELSDLESRKKELIFKTNSLNQEIELLQQELLAKENEAKQYSLEHERKNASIQEKQEYLKNLNKRVEEYDMKLRQVGGEIESYTVQLNEAKTNAENLSSEFARITKQIAEKQNLIGQIEQKMQIIKNELARYDINRVNKMSIIEKLTVERENLMHNKETSDTDRKKVEQALNEVTAEQNRIGEILTRQQKELEELEEKITRYQEEIQKKQEEINEYRIYTDTLANRLGKEEHIRFLKQSLKDRIIGLLRESIVASPGYEALVDICLYETLNFYLLNSVSAADLTNLPEGRFGFILNREQKKEPLPDELHSLKNLTQCIEFKNNKKFLSEYLSKFFLVDDFDRAMHYANHFPQYGFVTEDGILFYDNTIIAQKGEFGYFQINQRLNEYRKKSENLQNEIVFLTDEKNNLLDQTTKLTEEIEQAKEKMFALNIKKSELSMQLHTTQRQIETISSDIDAVADEITSTKTEIENIDSKICASQNAVTECENQVLSLKGEVAELVNNQKELEKQINEKNEELNKLILKIGINKELQSETEKYLQIAQNEIAELRAEIDKATRFSAFEKVNLLNQEISDINQKIQAKKEERSTCENQALDQQIEDISRQLDIIYEEISKLQKEQEEIQNSIMQVNFRIFELNHTREELLKKATEEFQTNLNEFIPEEIPEPEQKLNEVKERMARLGEINPLSLSAYEQEKKRLDEFLNQRNDIITAKQNLLKSIAELDARAKERFIDTFKEVKDKFNQVFSRFFEGGEADLILTDPANPLTSEVDIVVRMKGKRIKRINQLSGGERTLLAVSLLLAFYLVKPAPFCILDEIDAPLDDVNVVRFNKFLRELSQHTQVVIITHNRSTMEYADYIYGLTMEKPGQSKIISTRLEDLEPPIAEE